MPSNPSYGYRRGGSTIVKMPLDSTSAALIPGDMLIMATAGYVKQCAAGDKPIGVAVSSASAPSADGDTFVDVEIDPSAIFEYPPDAGTVSQGLVGTTMDVGGAQSIDIDASADDVIVCVGVDTARNTLLCRILFTYLGVV